MHPLSISIAPNEEVTTRVLIKAAHLAAGHSPTAAALPQGFLIFKHPKNGTTRLYILKKILSKNETPA